MSVTLATWIAQVFDLYLLVGVLFAALFAWRGAGRIDPTAREGTWGFRLLILPGSALLWPMLLKRWMTGTTEPPDETNAHRARARDTAGDTAGDTAAGGEP